LGKSELKAISKFVYNSGRDNQPPADLPCLSWEAKTANIGDVSKKIEKRKRGKTKHPEL
jgi:hypothetical protein